MATNTKQKIEDALHPLASELAEARSLKVLRIIVRGSDHLPVIEIILDGERPVTLQDCEEVSRAINDTVEEKKLLPENYRLDVLSPGIEEPIVEDFQFLRNLGRLVEVHYSDNGDKRTVHGILREFRQQEIAIEPAHKKGKKTVVRNEEVPIKLGKDEQLYDDPVALVRIERDKLTKVIAQVQFS